MLRLYHWRKYGFPTIQRRRRAFWHRRHPHARSPQKKRAPQPSRCSHPLLWRHQAWSRRTHQSLRTISQRSHRPSRPSPERADRRLHLDGRPTRRRENPQPSLHPARLHHYQPRLQHRHHHHPPIQSRAQSPNRRIPHPTPQQKHRTYPSKRRICGSTNLNIINNVV